MITQQDLQNRFTYHKPKEVDAQRFIDIRAQAYEFALYIVENVPDGREQSLAITHLEEVVMWANAGMARER